MSKINKSKDLKDLKTMVQLEDNSKELYQDSWRRNKFQHRKMIAKKNRKWLIDNTTPSEFLLMDEKNPFGDFPNVREKISEYFNDEKKRKWILHLITNFLPLNRVKQVPKLPNGAKNKCQLTDFELTDVKNILHGNRDKHIAFTGYQTSNFLSGIAVNELYKFVLNYTYDFDTVEGHIINYALDELRRK